MKRAEALPDRFRILFDHSSDAHFIFDGTGITDCNDATVKLLKCKSRDEVLNLHPAVLSPRYQPDGSLSFAVTIDGKPAIVAVWHDLTERKLHQKALEDMGRQLSEKNAARSGVPRLLESSGFPVGLVEEAEYEQREVALSPEDRLFILSDGLYEDRKIDGEEYGIERLREFFGQMGHFQLKETVRRAVLEIEHWTYPEPLKDDVSLIAVERV